MNENPHHKPVSNSITDVVRPREGRIIAGVCAGVARQYGWDVGIVRIIWAASILVGASIGFWAYVIAWLVLPNEDDRTRGFDQLKEQFARMEAHRSGNPSQQHSADDQHPLDDDGRPFDPYRD